MFATIVSKIKPDEAAFVRRGIVLQTLLSNEEHNAIKIALIKGSKSTFLTISTIKWNYFAACLSNKKSI